MPKLNSNVNYYKKVLVWNKIRTSNWQAISQGGADGKAPARRAADSGSNPGQGENFSPITNNIGPN